MPVHLTIICDTPEAERPPVWHDESIRCYSDFHKNIHAVIYGDVFNVADASIDMRKLALYQGWKIHGNRLICPACARRLQR